MNVDFLTLKIPKLLENNVVILIKFAKTMKKSIKQIYSYLQKSLSLNILNLCQNRIFFRIPKNLNVVYKN